MHIHINAPSSQPITVHSANIRDLLSVCKLEAQSFGAARILFGLWQRVGQRDVSTWIARQGGTPAGYLIAYDRELGDELTPYVAGVGVGPKYQRRGVGRELMHASIERFPKLWLHVRATNTPAIRMYQALKFVERDRINSFYQNGDDALVMTSWH